MRETQRDNFHKDDDLQFKCIHLREPDDCEHCLHTTRRRILRLLLVVCIEIIVLGVVALYAMG